MIRTQVKHLYGEKVAKNIQVVYGGSVQPESAVDYMAVPGVDGLLVGGASLNLEKFEQIVQKIDNKVNK